MTLAEALCKICKAIVDRSIAQSSRRCQVIKALIDVLSWGMIVYGLYWLIRTMWSSISKKRRENHL